MSCNLKNYNFEEIGEILFPDFSDEMRKSIVDEFGMEEVDYLKENGFDVWEADEAYHANI